MNDWEFHIQFHIHGKGVHLNGDGMAIWYVREPLIAGKLVGKALNRDTIFLSYIKYK